MKKLFAAMSALLLCVSISVQAKEPTGFYMGPSLSYLYFDSKRAVSGHDESGVLGLNFGYRFENDWSIEAGYGKEIADEEVDIFQVNAYRYLGKDDGGWRPYLLVGLSNFGRDGDRNIQRGEGHTNQLQAGFGLAHMLTDQFEFRGDVRMHHKISGGTEGINDGSINLAVNYYFNAPAAAPAPIVEPAPKPKPAPVVVEPETRTITVKLRVEFELDKAIVRAIYGDELHAVANAMKAQDDIVLVLEGHTDSTGTDAYNQNLSDRRAKAVKAKIVEDYGINPSRITTVGYGESRPVADNATVEGRALNRRVVGEMTYTEIVD